MKGSSRVMSAALVILILVPLAACADAREINDLAIVSSAAVDMDRDSGEYVITLEIAGTDTAVDGRSDFISVRGATVLEAMREPVRLMSKRLFISHMKALIIGEEAAREGLRPVIDFFCRSPQAGTDTAVMVTKGCTGCQAITSEPLTGNSKSGLLSAAGEADDRYLSSTTAAYLYGIYGPIESGDPVTVPAVGLSENLGREVLRFCGAGVFSGGKLTAFISPDTVRSVRFLRDDISSGLITVPDPEGPGGLTFDIMDSSADIEVEICEGEVPIRVRADIFADLSLSENSSGQKMTADELGKAARESLLRSVTDAVILARDVIKEDVFCLGSRLGGDGRQRLIGAGGENYLERTEFSVRVKVRINGTGLIRAEEK